MSTARFPTYSKPRFYLGMAAFMSLLVLVGFWPSYFGQVLHGIPNRPLLIHLHGLVFVGWMVLLVTQVFLAATGRIQAHRTVGTLGIAYGFLVFVMGLVVSVAAPVMHFTSGEQTMDEAAGFMIIPLGDMVLFAGFFIPAVVYRTRPEIHKRFILLATTALLFAATGRMRVFIPAPLTLFLWFCPVLIAMVYDKWTRRKVHPVYFLGLVMMVIGISRLFLVQAEAWMRIGRVILRTFA